MRLFTLDARLGAIAARIPLGARLWDVGSDHARLPVWLAANGRIAHAVASDIGELPLRSATRNIERFGVGGIVETELCDGLPISARDRADVFVIAGMGGGTIADILARAPWTQESGTNLLLQPMSSPEDLRAFLFESRYTITNETLLYADGRRYVLVEAVGGGAPQVFDRADLAAGTFIRDREHIESATKRLRNELGGADERATVELNDSIRKLEGILDDKSC